MIPVIPLFIVLRTKTLYPNIFHSNINILNSFHMISLQTMSTNINQLQNLICLFVGSQTNQTSIIIRKHNTFASNSSCIKKQMLKLPRFHNIWYLSFPFEQIHYITLINMQLNVRLHTRIITNLYRTNYSGHVITRAPLYWFCATIHAQIREGAFRKTCAFKQYAHRKCYM